MASFKNRVISALADQIREQLATAAKALEDAQDSIQSGDDRARNRGERGVIQEKAWLMEALVNRVDTLREASATLSRVDGGPRERVCLGCLVEVELDLESAPEARTYFFHSSYGGASVEVDGRTVTVLTPQAPMGRALLGKEADDDFEVRLEGKVIEGSVTEVD